MISCHISKKNGCIKKEHRLDDSHGMDNQLYRNSDLYIYIYSYHIHI